MRQRWYYCYLILSCVYDFSHCFPLFSIVDINQLLTIIVYIMANAWLETKKKETEIFLFMHFKQKIKRVQKNLNERNNKQLGVRQKANLLFLLIL